MQHLRDEIAVGTSDAAPALHEELERRRAGGGDRLLVRLLDAAPDVLEVHRLLVGPVGDPYPAADVYELELYPDLLAQLEDEGEQHLRGVDDVVGVELVGGDHRV